ncbi:hypothetical protein WJX74_004876 [Apatococcus lobatus]|uniref:Uncharacterized protein n=1 Tax=Apatococcus lobatus TaxID=904363 RepID=A0AAW1R062_9CHLO
MARGGGSGGGSRSGGGGSRSGGSGSRSGGGGSKSTPCSRTTKSGTTYTGTYCGGGNSGKLYKCTTPSGQTYIGQTTQCTANRYAQHAKETKNHDCKSFGPCIDGKDALNAGECAEIADRGSGNTLAGNHCDRCD